MAAKWIKSQYVGVRYREHKTRLHNGKPDRYFTIFYKHQGKLYEEALGWASDGWNAQKAHLELGQLKKAQTTGEGPKTLAEKRQQLKDQDEAKKERQETDARSVLTFGQFYSDTYFPQAKANKSQRSYDREDQLYRLWISPVIGGLALRDISLLHLEQIKQNMTDAKKSIRSIRYALAVIRQIFNVAKYLNLFDGTAPTANVKFPQEDNRRLRFLTRDEADRLLKALKSKSEQLYEIAMISIYCGARADEIFKLKWGDIDLDRGQMILWDTKNKKNRTAFMTEEVKAMLKNKTHSEKTDLIFPGREDKKIIQISDAFNRTVEELKLNEGVTDRRQKVVFHTLRHTFASWLVEHGESLYTVKELMGHSTLSMTERYAHLSNGALQKAVKRLENKGVEGE